MSVRYVALSVLLVVAASACSSRPHVADDSTRVADSGATRVETDPTLKGDSGGATTDSSVKATTGDAASTDVAPATPDGAAPDVATPDSATDASIATDAGPVEASPSDADPNDDAGLLAIPHLPYDANGWSIFPTDYTVTLYVDSATGNDSNPGTSATAPIKTLAHTASLIDSRPAGQTMAVLFKRGSAWPGEVLAMSNGGAASDHPLLLDGWDYGDSTQPRPALGRVSLWTASHVALAGLYVGPGGGELAGIENSGNAGTDILIEDTVVDGFWQNITICGTSNSAPFTYFRMRRSQSINAYDGSYATNDESKPQGIYLCALQHSILEENVFDHNAYANDDLSDATEFGHDIYISNYSLAESFDVRLIGNLISRGLHSVKGPATGVIENNLFDDDGFGGYIGSQGGSVTDNVLVDNTPKSVHTYHLSAPTTFIVESGGFSISGMSAGSILQHDAEPPGVPYALVVGREGRDARTRRTGRHVLDEKMDGGFDCCVCSRGRRVRREWEPEHPLLGGRSSESRGRRRGEPVAESVERLR